MKSNNQNVPIIKNDSTITSEQKVQLRANKERKTITTGNMPPSFYRWENRGSNRLRIPKITRTVSERTQSFWPCQMFLAPCQPALTWPVACFIIINSTEATNNKKGLGLTWILLQGYLLSSVQATRTAPCWSSQNSYLSKDAILSRVTQGMVATPHS